jgi:predicted flap endonuclease-1-like 5' DNA nuclease
LRSELATRQADAANLVATQAEVEQLRAEVAEHQACTENLAAARAEIEGLRQEVARLQPLEPSDLKRIEGIGAKIEGLLNDAGILTFQQLATTDTERLRMILSAAGERYRLADPTSWPEQARLAADEKWDELSQLQDELKSGRQRSPGQGGATPV